MKLAQKTNFGLAHFWLLQFAMTLHPQKNGFAGMPVLLERMGSKIKDIPLNIFIVKP